MDSYAFGDNGDLLYARQDDVDLYFYENNSDPVYTGR